MIHLDLDDNDKVVLLETLDGYLDDLSFQLADTDRMDFREQLKAKRAVLQKIAESVRAAQETAK